MKIVLPFFVFGKFGGIRVVSNIINVWANAGHIVEILTIGTRQPYFPISDRIRIVRLKNKYRILWHLYKHFNEYDAVIGVYVISAYLIFIASLLRCCFKKSFYYIQAYEAEKEFANMSWLWLQLVKLSYKMPLHRIVNADIYKNYKSLNAKDVVYPGLDFDKYKSKELSFFNDTLKIGCIGRTEEWKGTRDVCDAMEILKNRGEKIDFYIAFNDFDTIEHHFVKPDGDVKLAAFYREMDVVVAPGHIQLGAVHYPVIESMAVGTSIVTTGYLPADESNSYLVKIKNPEQISDAIMEINRNRDVAVNKRIKALNDVQQFSWENVSSKFLTIISKGVKK